MRWMGQQEGTANKLTLVDKFGQFYAPHNIVLLFSVSSLWLSSLLPTHPLFDYLAASHSLSEPTVVPLVFPESYHFLPRTTHLNQNFFSNDNPSLQRSNLFTISLGLSSTKLLIVLGRLLNDFVTYTIIVWPFLAISPRGSCNFSRKVGWYG